MLEMAKLEPLMAWLAAMPAGVRGVRIHATLDTGAVWRFSCGVNQGRAPVAQRAAAHAAARARPDAHARPPPAPAGPPVGVSNAQARRQRRRAAAARLRAAAPAPDGRSAALAPGGAREPPPAAPAAAGRPAASCRVGIAEEREPAGTDDSRTSAEHRGAQQRAADGLPPHAESPGPSSLSEVPLQPSAANDDMAVVVVDARRKRAGTADAGEAGAEVPPASKRLASSMLAVPLGPPPIVSAASPQEAAAEMQDVKRQVRALEDRLAQVKARAETAEAELGLALSLAARPPAPSDAQLQALAHTRGWSLVPA